MKQTFQPKKRQRSRVHGFLKRMALRTAVRCWPAAVLRAART